MSINMERVNPDQVLQDLQQTNVQITENQREIQRQNQQIRDLQAELDSVRRDFLDFRRFVLDQHTGSHERLSEWIQQVSRGGEPDNVHRISYAPVASDGPVLRDAKTEFVRSLNVLMKTALNHVQAELRNRSMSISTEITNELIQISALFGKTLRSPTLEQKMEELKTQIEKSLKVPITKKIWKLFSYMLFYLLIFLYAMKIAAPEKHDNMWGILLNVLLPSGNFDQLTLGSPEFFKSRGARASPKSNGSTDLLGSLKSVIEHPDFPSFARDLINEMRP